MILQPTVERTAMLINNYELKIRNGNFVIPNSRLTSPVSVSLLQVIKVAGEFIR